MFELNLSFLCLTKVTTNNLNLTQPCLKPHLIIQIFLPQNGLDQKNLSNQFFAKQRKKKEKHLNHTRCIFLTQKYIYLFFSSKNLKIFKRYSGGYQMPLDV